MAASVENGVEQFSFWDFKGQEDYVDTWFLTGKPYGITLVVSAYLLFVLFVGPAYMKKRPPINLRNVLLAYNACQVGMSIFLFDMGIRHMKQFGIFETTCLYVQDDMRKYILSSSYWYFFAKVTELLDTIFFVLRKKHDQVTFLHVYHHSIVVIVSWSYVKYGKISDLIFLGTLNSFVHICMYLYYGLAAFPSLKKYLWWKKYLTSMQLVQFALVLLQILVNTTTSNCPPSPLTLGLTIFNSFLFLYLFGKFYLKTYGDSNKNNVVGHQNGNAKKSGLNSTYTKKKWG